MRIPSGDLAPARKRRRSAYRRRGRTLPVLLSLLLLGALGAGAVLLRRDDEPERLAACPASVSQVVVPPPGQVRLVLLNGTARDGLGRSVGVALAARGFGVLSTGNAPQPLTGPSRVVFGPGGRGAATVLAAHVLGARLVPAPTAPARSVQLVLGTSFARLRTPQEVPVALRALAAPPPRPVAPPARPAPSPSASPC